MSLESIPAHVFITKCFPHMSEVDLNNLKLVNKDFCVFISRVQVAFYLGRSANYTPIDDDTIRALSVLAAAQPIQNSQRQLPESIATKEIFQKCLNALGLLHPRNAVQLRNRYRVIWHLNYSFPQEVRTPVQRLKDAVLTDSAVIGKFSIDTGEDKIDYNVSVIAYLSEPYDAVFKFHGNTRLYIHPAQHCLPAKPEDRRKFHGLSIINTTQQSGRGWTNEQYLDYNQRMDLRKQWFDIELEFRDVVRDPKGSNRELDQKIVQIMVEILLQNRSKSHLKVSSNHADYAILAMGGFVDQGTEEMINKVIEFRDSKDHKLFPPYRDYGSNTLTFNRERLNQKNVRLSREQGIEPESWLEIIERQPILHHEGGLIPDYWTTKPVDELADIELD